MAHQSHVTIHATTMAHGKWRADAHWQHSAQRTAVNNCRQATRWICKPCATASHCFAWLPGGLTRWSALDKKAPGKHTHACRKHAHALDPGSPAKIVLMQTHGYTSIAQTADSPMANMLHTILRAMLGGAMLYCTIDQASDLTTYFTLKNMAMRVAMDNDELRRQLGVEADASLLTTSPWYDSSIRFTHQHHIATAVFSLHGKVTSTDVEIKVLLETPHTSTSVVHRPCADPFSSHPCWARSCTTRLVHANGKCTGYRRVACTHHVPDSRAPRFRRAPRAFPPASACCHRQVAIRLVSHSTRCPRHKHHRGSQPS